MIKKSLKKFTQIGPWVLSAILGFLLWFNIALDKKYDYTIKADLKIMGIPQNIIPTQPIPEFVDINIQETGKELLKLILTKQKDNVRVRIPLTNPVVGENIIVIKKENIFWPSEYSQPYYYLDNNTINLNLYPETQKEVPVKANFIPAIRDGYIMVGDIKTEPNKVVAKGPHVNLEKLDKAGVYYNLRNELADTLKMKLPLVESNIYNIKFSPDSVLVTLPIQKEAVKLVESIPVRLINVPSHLEGSLLVNPPYLTMEISAGESIIKNISARDFNVFIDYSTIEQDRLGNDIAAVINPFKEINWFRSFPKKFRIISKER